VTDVPSGKPVHDPCADWGTRDFFFVPGTLIIWVIPIIWVLYGIVSVEKLKLRQKLRLPGNLLFHACHG
jgi:hypothetical protein